MADRVAGPGAEVGPPCPCPRDKPCPATPYITTKTPRTANKSDVPRIIEITLVALRQDPFYRYLWQFREDHPNEHRYFWEHRIYCDLYNPRYEFLVLELESQRAENSDEWIPAKGTPIISFAIWERKGDSKKALEWEWKKLHGVNGIRYLESTVDKQRLLRDFPEDRPDATKKRLEACETSLQEANKDFSAGLSTERLQMELVCTYPCYQRRGAASKLVQWGVDRARQEEVKFLSAAASCCGEKLYQKNLFKYLEGKETREVDDAGETTTYALMYMLVSPEAEGNVQ